MNQDGGPTKDFHVPSNVKVSFNRKELLINGKRLCDSRLSVGSR